MEAKRMNWDTIPERRGEPDFSNLLAVLNRKEPARPTLFEFFLNDPLYRRLTPDLDHLPDTPLNNYRRSIQAYFRLGYDYHTILVPGFSFSQGIIDRHRARTVSLNEGSVIGSWEDFKAYHWPDPHAAEYELLDELLEFLPPGMKLIPYTPNGVLENMVDLVGYERLCVLTKDEPELVLAVAEAVTSRLLAYYEHVVHHPAVGACIANDDWGFKTQTMFSPPGMRKFVFPFHKRIVDFIHAAGKPVILHSCGHFTRIIDDIIEDLHFDARHSYEDAILPIEEAYELYHDRIALLGGIDVDFVCRATPEEVYRRSRRMLERAAGRGSFALGTGNSVPDYVPDSGYFAVVRAALDTR
jgi:uroporphyrinogen decarboxylase